MVQPEKTEMLLFLVSNLAGISRPFMLWFTHCILLSFPSSSHPSFQFLPSFSTSFFSLSFPPLSSSSVFYPFFFIPSCSPYFIPSLLLHLSFSLFLRPPFLFSFFFPSPSFSFSFSFSLPSPRLGSTC